MRIQPFGDSSLLVSFEKEISTTTNQKVISLFKAIELKEGVAFLIPAYNSLTVGINQQIWSLHEATIFLREIAGTLEKQEPIKGKKYIIPVCYEEAFALDLGDITKALGITRSKIIELHTSKTYRVFMLGFVAGFAYMGTLDAKLESPRKANPRLSVPTGSVGLAGLQTGIYPTEAPGGWQIIGRTPLVIFSPERASPTLLNAGDEVRFRAISSDEYRIIKLKIETGIFEMEVFNE